jgi:hypothetical protein
MCCLLCYITPILILNPKNTSKKRFNLIQYYKWNDCIEKTCVFYHSFLPKSLNNPLKGEEKTQPIKKKFYIVGNFITNFFNVKEPFNEDDM